MSTLLALPAAVGGAVTFALAAVGQQRAAATAPSGESLRPRLLLRLAHRGDFLLATLGLVAAYALQAVGLALATVALVEPIVATELIFAIPLAIRVHGARAGLAEWSGSIAAAAGVSLFIVSSSPGGTTRTAGPIPWLATLMGSVAVLVVLAGAARWSARRGMLLGAAAGLANGIVAVITKAFFVDVGSSGLLAALESWQPELLLLFGAAGFLFAQSAYQAAPLAESLPLIDGLEPGVSVAVAATTLGEQLALGPVNLAGELGGGLLAVAGIVLLARSPVVLSIYEDQRRRQRREEHQGAGGPEQGGSTRDPSRRDGGQVSSGRA